MAKKKSKKSSRSKKIKLVKTPQRFARFRHNWSWWDSIVGFMMGSFVGIGTTLYLSDSHREAVTFINEWTAQIIEIFLIAFLIGRIISVARWPRNPPLDYNKITVAGAIAANFITMIMGLMLLIVTLALVAPHVLELVAGQIGG